MADEPEQPTVTEKVATGTELQSDELAESAGKMKLSDKTMADGQIKPPPEASPHPTKEDSASKETDGAIEPSYWPEDDGVSSGSNEQAANEEQVGEDPRKPNLDTSGEIDEEASPTKPTNSRTSSEKAAVRKKPSKRHKSVESFEKLGMPQDLLEAIRAANIEKPNTLQKLLLPEIFNDQAKDFYFKTNPHAGKKTAFLISALHRIERDLDKPQVIVLTSSSELGEYIFRAASALAGRLNIKVLQPTPDQGVNESLNGHLIVTSIQGLLVYMERGSIDLNELKCVIFDEIDLLAGSKKNESTCNQIVHQLVGKSCQLLFFSTFYGEGVVEFARKLKPIRSRPLMVINLTEKDWIAKNVLQFFAFSIDQATKQCYLVKVLQNVVLNKIVVYVSDADKMTDLNEHLLQNGFQTVFLTGNTGPAERLDAIERFNSNQEEQTVLITHYPLTHGIRLNDVRMIINFDLPPNHANVTIEYLHRAKRCSADERRPCFVVNLTDSHSAKQFSRIQSFFKIRMVRLNLRDAISFQ